MSTELAVSSYPAQASTPAAVKAWMEHVTEMRRAVLVEGVDYMKIPGTPKPCLLQPGAEKLLLLSGLGFTMERIEKTVEGVTYRCTVPGRAQCEGYAGRDEKNFRQAPWNTIVKMAQKRAKVGAISSALALSGLFTVDLEDYQPPVGNGAQGELATASRVAHETPDREPSNAEAKRALIEAFETYGNVDPLEARAMASRLWGDRTSITKDELDELVGKALEDGAELAARQ